MHFEDPALTLETGVGIRLGEIEAGRKGSQPCFKFSEQLRYYLLHILLGLDDICRIQFSYSSLSDHADLHSASQVRAHLKAPALLSWPPKDLGESYLPCIAHVADTSTSHPKTVPSLMVAAKGLCSSFRRQSLAYPKLCEE